MLDGDCAWARLPSCFQDLNFVSFFLFQFEEGEEGEEEVRHGERGESFPSGFAGLLPLLGRTGVLEAAVAPLCVELPQGLQPGEAGRGGGHGSCCPCVQLPRD